TAAIALTVLLILEHTRSPRPSDLACLYLVSSILCDAVAITVPHGMSPLPGRNNRDVRARFKWYLLLLVLEHIGPRGVAEDSGSSSDLSPEEKSTLLQRAFFSWINPFLYKGYRNLILDEELPPLGRSLKPELTRARMLRAWEQRCLCIWRPMAAAAAPRLALILFQYSQPLLIKHSIRYVSATRYWRSEPIPDLTSTGYWLVVSSIFIYVGLALVAASSQHRLNRLRLITNSALIGLIHEKTMDAPSTPHGGGATAEAITLMSTDASDLSSIGQIVLESAAYAIEVVIGFVLLAREVGWIWPLPLVLILVCSRITHHLTLPLAARQRAWNAATQRRLTATSALLGSIKSVKMLGLTSALARRAQSLREEEMHAAAKVRWAMVWYNASANALGMFTPALTLTLFAILGTRNGSLNPETAFTAMAVLSMVTHPANMVMTLVPRGIAASAGFGRIQAFLVRSTNTDGGRQRRGVVGDGVAVEVKGVTLGKGVLRGVELVVKRGEVVVVTGPVGSGKSLLVRGVLGEVEVEEGRVGVGSGKVAYCAQRVWLPGGTVRDVVRGVGGEEEWYQRVLEACCLRRDLDALPEGDGTQVGSGGMNLSGGQRARVALARAVFARCELVLLDDCFSALDGETETQVFTNLLGPEGLFRKQVRTVILVANSAQFFEAADRVVILGDGGIQEQGAWRDLKTKGAAIEKFIPSNGGHHSGGDAPTPTANLAKLSAQLRARDEAAVDLARQTGDITLYGYYFRFAGIVNLVVLATCAASTAFFMTIPQYWLKLWTEKAHGASAAFYITGFLLLSLMAWISTNGIMSSTVLRVAPRSGLKLHHRLLDVVTGAFLSFFSENETGTILNRCVYPDLDEVQDIQLIDKQLPMALQSTGGLTETEVFKLIMQTIVLFMAQRWLSLSLPVCALVLYVVQKIYLRTSRQLRFLELESRAAVFSSFLESVDGIETIRAFNWRSRIIEENTSRLEASQRPEYLLMSLQRWLNIVLDLMAAVIATGVIIVAVAMRGRVSGGQLGVALNIMLVANSTLLKLVSNWTTLEVSLGAVSRTRILEKTTPSEWGATADMPEGWPSRGDVRIEGVTASYGNDTPSLRDVTLHIPPGQKTIICGRTGSGKSSLLLTLLRMLPPSSGTITIDGIDISTLPRDLIRQQCFVVAAQDALLLPGESLRFNLDPSRDTNIEEEAMIDALEKTGLWSHFSSPALDTEEDDYYDHPVLDRNISSFPALSAGQTQLFAVARAVYKARMLVARGLRPVVLLDEVSAALDAEGEALVGRVVDGEFVGRGLVVVIVSHRVLGSGGLREGLDGEVGEVGGVGERDRVVMMADGRVLEARE
ncbi:ABC transporter, partial [Podospora conica]